MRLLLFIPSPRNRARSLIQGYVLILVKMLPLCNNNRCFVVIAAANTPPLGFSQQQRLLFIFIEIDPVRDIALSSLIVVLVVEYVIELLVGLQQHIVDIADW